MNSKYFNFLIGLLLCGLSISCKQEANSNSGATVSPDSAGQVKNGQTADNKEDNDNSPLTTYTLDSETHDFGKITEGEKVTHVYKLKNTGENPLVISDVKPSCGCTSPNWTKDPIPPGQEGKVEVQFDSQGKSGTQSKTVTVMANTEPKVKVLKFTGEIVPAKK